MPLNKKGEEIKHAMEEEYGEKKGEEVFYASENKGTISGVTKKNGHFYNHEKHESPEHEHAGKVLSKHKH